MDEGEERGAAVGALVERGRTAGRRDWRRLLAGGSAREVLARIVDGDPLGVRAVVGRELKELRFLMDSDRVQLRALALVARRGGRYRGRPALAVWLAERVRDAIGELREEEAERLREDPHEIPAEPAGAWVELARPLGLPPARMRAACARFNLLPFDEREAFFQLVLERRAPVGLPREGEASLPALARRARRAIEVVLGPAGAPRGAPDPADRRGAR